MTDAMWAAAIAAIPGTIAAVVGFHNRNAIREIHLTLNSRLDALVIASKDSGRIEERADQRAAIVERNTLPQEKPRDEAEKGTS